MQAIDEIQSALKHLSKVQNKNMREGFTTATSIIENSDVESIVELVESVLAPYLADGEKISSQLSKGEIFDCGKAYFKILGGHIIEYYHYPTTTSLFIRIYNISRDDKTWIALYMDENKNTPWWEKESSK
ncbi:hypothetical protein BMS3Abin16_00177 [archaeon BMS3Abin16]|nr:hypothetical protein BMS3Abin16_00177 [archaeon BMS3Abin16]